uniref:Tc1-like transposase DDE domain-containing protein n=1 Tax=Oryzias latipes TaxID=8090 RepID=A0A3P9I5B3_ORYLA
MKNDNIKRIFKQNKVVKSNYAGFQKVGVSHVVWPTMTSDLNPIEHVWDQLKTRTSFWHHRKCESGNCHRY